MLLTYLFVKIQLLFEKHMWKYNSMTSCFSLRRYLFVSKKISHSDILWKNECSSFLRSCTYICSIDASADSSVSRTLDDHIGKRKDECYSYQISRWFTTIMKNSDNRWSIATITNNTGMFWWDEIQYCLIFFDKFNKYTKNFLTRRVITCSSIDSFGSFDQNQSTSIILLEKNEFAK